MDTCDLPAGRSVRPTCAAALVAALLLGCGSPDQGAQPSESFDAPSNRGQAFVADDNSDPNILNIALGSEDHTTLVAAVQAAEMENILVNAGPLTVFRPYECSVRRAPRWHAG